MIVVALKMIDPLGFVFTWGLVLAVIEEVLHLELGGVQAFEGIFGLGQQFVGEIDRASVVGHQHEHADDFQIVLLGDVPDGEEVALGFGHFFVVDVDVAVVDPVVGEGAAIGAFGLGNFVFVVGEDQILAAAVNVDGLAEEFAAHG